LKRLQALWFDDVCEDEHQPQKKGAEMRSVLRSVKKRKKKRRMGQVEIIGREQYGDLELNTKVELIRSLVPLGLMHVEEVLDEEVVALAGDWHARKEQPVRGRRHGSNPGSVRMAGQRVPIRVPRVRSVQGGEIPLRSYGALSRGGEMDDLLLKRVLFGISCRNYEAAAEAIPGAIGLSSSTVSRKFIHASAKQLKQLRERDLSKEDVVALLLDGKTFADATMVVALGITLSGEKRFLGFVETDTENEKVLTPFLRSLLERGLDISQGLLVIIDGSKGLRAAVMKAFRNRALVQRCQWHKRENVVSYLSKSEQASWRQRLQRAYTRPDYDEAATALRQLHDELEDRNQSAARSLAEGLEETLTLHRLGVYGMLGCSLKTTNCLESVNALVEERCAKVDHWKTSNQRHRWLATALIEIEPRLRKVKGYRHLPKLREALKRELKIEKKKSSKRAA
jgi:transposase-like protein